MTINARLKEFRKSQSLNQAELGKRIGLGQGAISKMEQEGSTIIPQNIRLLCDTFNIDEVWLRTGEGDMFKKKKPTNIMEKLQQELELDAKDMDIIKAFVELSPQQRRKGIEFMEALSGNIADFVPDETQGTKKDAPDSDASAQGTDCTHVENANLLPTSCQPAAELTKLSKLTAPQDTPTPVGSDAGRPDGLSDEEWAMVLMLREEKEKGSPTSSATNSELA